MGSAPTLDLGLGTSIWSYKSPSIVILQLALWMSLLALCHPPLPMTVPLLPRDSTLGSCDLIPHVHLQLASSNKEIIGSLVFSQ